MKSKLLATLFLAGTSLFAGPRVSIGIGIGQPVYGYAPPPPPPARVYVAPRPGPGYSWVNGYWYPAGPRYQWRAGYWTRPPYGGARWVAPRYNRNAYYKGYWRR